LLRDVATDPGGNEYFRDNVNALKLSPVGPYVSLNHSMSTPRVLLMFRRYPRHLAAGTRRVQLLCPPLAPRMFVGAQAVLFALLVSVVIPPSAYAVNPSAVNPSCPMNVTGTGTPALTVDGVLLSRYARGVRNAELTNSLLPSGGDAGAVQTAVTNAATRLDMDGDGAFTATDAAIVSRYLAGYQQQGWAAGLSFAINAERSSADEIAGFIAAGCPPPVNEPANTCPAPTPVTRDLACVVQAGGCDVVLGNGSGSVIIDSRNSALFPSGTTHFAGKTICIKSGQYLNGGAWIYQVDGTANNPVTITNCGGQVVLQNDLGEASMELVTSRHVHVTGTGSTAHSYGFLLRRSVGTTFHARFGSSDIEVDHIEVAGGQCLTPDSASAALCASYSTHANEDWGYAGIGIKTYPSEGAAYVKGSFVQRNTKVHDNYVHDVPGEGLYIGPSHYGDVAADGYTPTVQEAPLAGVSVRNNCIERTGRDGIQVGAAISGLVVRKNFVKDFAYRDIPANSVDECGININPGSRGLIDRNWIENTANQRSQGICHQGTGDTWYTNNIVTGAQYGIILLRNSAHNTNENLPNVYFYNNTIAKSWGAALYAFCNNLDAVKIINTAFAGQPTNSVANGNDFGCLQYTTSPFIPTLGLAGFVNPSARDYRLLSSSQLVDAGTSLVGTINGDIENADRTQKPKYDIGAYVLRP
jgi:hypothetical protein